jgi:hypothetical protein
LVVPLSFSLKDTRVCLDAGTLAVPTDLSLALAAERMTQLLQRFLLLIDSTTAPGASGADELRDFVATECAMLLVLHTMRDAVLMNGESSD